MLKFISKSIFVSVLCGTLMLMDFSYKGIMLNAARAESVKTEKIDDSDLMSTLTMTVVGTLAKRLYSYKMTTDIMLAAAGGAAFLGGEVLAYLKLKDVMEGLELEIIRDKKGNINKEQIATLERLRASYVSAKEAAETKKNLQTLAAAAFAAAGVMAYTMAAVDTKNFTACSSGITGALSAAGAALAKCAGPHAAACVTAVNSCITSLKEFSGSFMDYELVRQSVAQSAPNYTAAIAKLNTSAGLMGTSIGVCSAPASEAVTSIKACQPKYIEDLEGMSAGPIPAVSPEDAKINHDSLKLQYVATAQNKNLLFFEKFLNIFFSPVEAALFSTMGIASGVAISYMIYTSATLGPTIDLFMLIPQKRAIVWGILAGLTYTSIGSTENVIKQIESHISKIDGILNGMYKMADGATGSQVNKNNPKAQTAIRANQKLNFSQTDYGEVELSKDGSNKFPCYTGADSTKCKSFQDSLKDTNGFNDLNLESQMQLSSIMSAANGLNGTSKISSATIKSAAAVGGSANALKSAYDRSVKKNQEDLKNAGSKFNIGDESKKLSGLLDSKMRAGLKKSNSTPSGMMSAMYGGKGAIASGSAAVADQAKENTAATKPITPGGNTFDISGAGAGGGVDLGLGGSNNGAAKELSAEELAKLNESQKAIAGDTLGEYELKNNDISNDSSSSIFELISNRYQKSGYPRLFKVKEPLESAPVNK